MAGLLGKQRAGKAARTQLNGTNMLNNEYSTNYRVDKLPTDCFENVFAAATGNVWQEQQIVGIAGLDWSIKGDWNANKNAYDSPPALYPQDSYGLGSTGVLIYTNITDNVFWSIPQSTILSSGINTRVRDKVLFTADAVALPGWNQPTGSV